ncbi:hypothetical protein LXA43DRAFT_1061006 [Ganoderma leucocontextum]|nr:hypothetical protein LXA43DRAFT_1061006 [Ganoderma leucocontextum]
MWHTLPSFATFIYTLPQDSWTYTSTNLKEIPIPTRELVADDFARFRLYSPLVRVISEPWTPLRKGFLSASMWDAFQKHCPEPLPNLHTLICRRIHQGKHLGDHFHMLLGPSIRSFDLQIQRSGGNHLPRQQIFNALEADTASPKLLNHLGRHCPHLHNFKLDPYPFAANATEPLAEAICRWDCLRSLQALGTPLKAGALRHLASLPCLRLLKANVNLLTPALDDGLIVQPGFPTFAALRELVIHANHLETCTRIVDAIHSPSLDDVVLYATEHAVAETIRSLCTALSRHIGLKHLLIGSGVGTYGWKSRRVLPYRHISPHMACILGTSDLAPVPLALSVLAPLLSLRSLERISLRGTCYASLDDRALSELARAWPDLHSAALYPNASHPYATRVTLAGLAPLAALRRLRWFGVALSDVGAEDVDAAFKVMAPPRPMMMITPEAHWPHDAAPLTRSGPSNANATEMCPLRGLYVGHARLCEERAEGVSAALSAWFPELRRAECLMSPWRVRGVGAAQDGLRISRW